SEKFNPEYWNYAKLISGVLRYRMPIKNVIKMVRSLQLGGDDINNWKNGVVRALNKYVKDEADTHSQLCPNCGNDTLTESDGETVCTNCGYKM
ncbi:MAG: TFIIB-type zinc ribbon-containing protein, partial [Bacteroidaceae bacterium]|nr:TFIIB-type zinc ribbon-containing protein [Bacteroidaceae bacterium]